MPTVAEAYSLPYIDNEVDYREAKKVPTVAEAYSLPTVEEAYSLKGNIDNEVNQKKLKESLDLEEGELSEHFSESPTESSEIEGNSDFENKDSEVEGSSNVKDKDSKIEESSDVEDEDNEINGSSDVEDHNVSESRSRTDQMS